jgi:diadenosine tetraphosphate (Ap4A) HIT family hydrolase
MEQFGLPSDLYIAYLSGYEYEDDDIPRQYSLVRFVREDMSSPFSRNVAYIFLGEMPNMPGHCVVIGEGSRILAGQHTENFKELTDEELDSYPPA